jgi:transcription elongation factor GreA
MEKTFLTRAGHNKLVANLEYLMNVRRKEIAAQLAFARSLGDLSENAEYEAAKHAFDLNEIKIKELSEKLHSIEIVNETDIPSDRVYIGATVKVLDMEYKEEETYTMVSSAESNPGSGALSVESPVGKALLGHREGDIVEINVPRGTIKYEIKSITRHSKPLEIKTE